MSNSYIDDLTHMASGLDAIKEHSLILHYPAVDESLFGGADGSAVDSTKTAEELEAIDAKRKEQGRRLQEQVEKQRMEKVG